MPKSSMRYFFLLLAVFFVYASSCQDVHYTQFYNAAITVNPALSGHFEGDQRMAVNYRRQWFSIPVPYETITMAYDAKGKVNKQSFGFGGYLNYDQAGDANLSWLQLGFNGAYHLQLSPGSTIGIGVNARLGQRALDPARLYFDDQYVDNFYDPNQPTQESIGTTTSGFGSLGAGYFYQFQALDSRTKGMIGMGVFHLNSPAIHFIGDENVAIPMLFSNQLEGLIQAHERWDIAVNGLYQIQGPYRELLGMLGARYYLDSNPDNLMAAQLGGGYRTSDAALFYLDIFYQDWIFGFSYDFNISPLDRATNQNGGPELSLQYIIRSVKPPESFKVCPIF
jgi:type IX secretion system PorP/SprF family membrane protein